MGRAGAVLLLLALGAGRVAAEEPAPDPAPVPSVPSDRLPELGVVGDLPPEAETLVLEIDREGKARIAGKPWNFMELSRLFPRRAELLGPKDARGRSRLHVLFRADRDVRWQAVETLRFLAMAKDTGIHRFLFAARPAAGGREGAVASYMDGLGGTEPADPDGYSLAVSLRARDGAEDPPGAAVLSILEERLGDDWVPSAELEVDPDVTLGAVLEASDAILRWGVPAIGIISPLKGGSPDRAVARPLVSVNRSPVRSIPAGWKAPRPPARVVGALAGNFGYPAPPGTKPPPGRVPVRPEVLTRWLPSFSAFDPPAPADAVVLEVTPRPVLRVGKDALDLVELKALLVARSEGRREEGPPRVSSLDVVLRADGDCRWGDVRWLLECCADPAVGVYRLRIAGRSAKDGAEGTIEAFLPRDLGGPPAARDELPILLRRRKGEGTSRLFIFDQAVGTTEGPEAWAAAAARLGEIARKNAGLAGAIDADAGVPWREVAQAIDLLRGAGIRDVRFRAAR